jgi:transposase
MAYLRLLRQVVRERGAGSLVYLDESGFTASAHRTHGWGRIGTKVYGERSGNARPRTSLIAAKHGSKLLAPILFDGATNAEWFNHWLTEHLFKELPKNATLILDNAAFHTTSQTKEIIEASPFHMLYLPPYSPDFNPIEKVFANLKKRRQYAPKETSLDHLVNTYENYLV